MCANCAKKIPNRQEIISNLPNDIICLFKFYLQI